MADKLTYHELIAQLTNLAIELGRTPNRDEFVRIVKNRRVIDQYGGYTTLCIAAGLEANASRAKKLSNQIFERPIPEVLADYKPRDSVVSRFVPTLGIGDTHFPFVSERVLEAIYTWAQKHRPKRIVQVGDLYDMYAHTKFPKSLNVYKPEEEETLAVEGATKMWAELKRICPQAECVQLKGNHDIRPLRRTLEHAPSLEHIVSKHLDRLMTFPGVTLITDPRQEFIADGIQFIHGYKSKIGEHRDYTLMHTICGHQHVGGVVYRRIRGQTLFELNCGLVGDPESKAFGYTPQKITTATPGFGWLDEDGPRFIAL